MPSIKGLEWTFDTEAALYEKMRPGYVDALYQQLFAYLPIGPDSHALEIGIGGGQATLPVLKTGCTLTAVEYGPHFSQLCREKFREFENFSVITGKFEDYEAYPGSFDLIYSASAFHWIPEEIGYPKVYHLLKNGGAFARFANHPYRDKGQEQLNQEIQKLYAVYMNSTSVPSEYSEADARQRADLAAKYGFEDIRYSLFHRVRCFTADEYIRLLGTYSDHIALDAQIQKKFYAGIRQAINDFGGQINIYDTIDLELARKP